MLFSSWTTVDRVENWELAEEEYLRRDEVNDGEATGRLVCKVVPCCGHDRVCPFTSWQLRSTAVVDERRESMAAVGSYTCGSEGNWTHSSPSRRLSLFVGVLC